MKTQRKNIATIQKKLNFMYTNACVRSQKMNLSEINRFKRESLSGVERYHTVARGTKAT
jgi:hypothetical protein